MYFHFTIAYLDCLRTEFHPERGFMIRLESFFSKSEKQAAFPNTYVKQKITGVANDDKLKHEVVVIGHDSDNLLWYKLSLFIIFVLMNNQ